jgi:hypothetical protein
MVSPRHLHSWGFTPEKLLGPGIELEGKAMTAFGHFIVDVST